ncbi:DUF4290 domain-containing protein [Hufsiella ginkgonis]|uniref:DUF4290 domain-containing protein n=1 Tax=Hufsiella ginkgonis TaxID=2695274 RepID=A0A7K1XXL3_9SPHI|nr:DUF4290 domain-containing protein [Hufsiella ginkgonis]MXV15577.1 DUF4290 domain-containing protein [Hufsiella ginkgonis]
MNFDYNTTRKKLLLAEYGRNVQNMVAYICALENKDERNAYAQVVIDLMGFLNPHLRDVADFKHKLWDHLHIISDFKIDVDSPYPKPSEDAIHFKPNPMPYPQRRIRYKHYGKTIEVMIDKARQIEDADRKQHMVQSIANFMKMAYVTWNKDSVADETILSDLKELSKGELSLQENVNLTKVEFRTPPPGSGRPRPANQNQNNKGRQNNGNGSNNNRSNNTGGGQNRQRNGNNNPGKRY